MRGWSSTSSVCGAIHSQSSILSVSALRLNFPGFFHYFVLSGKTWFALAQNSKNGTDFNIFNLYILWHSLFYTANIRGEILV